MLLGVRIIGKPPWNEAWFDPVSKLARRLGLRASYYHSHWQLAMMHCGRETAMEKLHRDLGRGWLGFEVGFMGAASDMDNGTFLARFLEVTPDAVPAPSSTASAFPQPRCAFLSDTAPDIMLALSKRCSGYFQRSDEP
jgi:hypothetical protein